MTSDCSQLYCNVYNKFDKNTPATGLRVARVLVRILAFAGTLRVHILAFANYPISFFTRVAQPRLGTSNDT